MSTVIAFQEIDFFKASRFAFLRRYRRWLMIAFLVFSDLLGLLVSLPVSMLIWRQVRTDFLITSYFSVFFTVAGLLLAIYLVMGLYPATGLGPVEELRRLTYGTTLLFLGLIVISFYLRNTLVWSRAIIGLTWFFMLCGIPILRKLIRRLAVRAGLWGEPVIVIGAPDCAVQVTQELRNKPLSGFWPVLCITTNSIEDVFPDFTEPTKAVLESKALFGDVEIVILAPGKEHFKAAKNLLVDNSHHFKRIILMFDEERLGSVWFNNIHLLEFLGLEVKHRWGNQSHLLIKRMIDLVLIIITLPFLLLLFLIISIAILVDSPGNVFYLQKRIGKNGEEFNIWKFRTMYVNAKELLDRYFEQNPAYRQEWAETFKLKYDPRVTRVGKILRSTSLDELPQLWNVLRGEMSMIGPRPIVAEEVQLYGQEFEILKRIVPGITGLWQISGRNDLPYRERVNLDLYYLQNWSIWLDAHILMHTVLAVLLRRGAY